MIRQSNFECLIVSQNTPITVAAQEPQMFDSPNSPTPATPGIRAVGRLLRRQEVEREVGLSRSSIYRLMDQGKFPRPVQTAERAVRWPSAVIDAWKLSLPTVDQN